MLYGRNFFPFTAAIFAYPEANNSASALHLIENNGILLLTLQGMNLRFRGKNVKLEYFIQSSYAL